MKILIKQIQIQKKRNNNHKNNLKRDKFKIKKIVSFKIHKLEIKQSIKKKRNFIGDIKKGQKRLKQENKNWFEFKKKSLKAYDFWRL